MYYILFESEHIPNTLKSKTDEFYNESEFSISTLCDEFSGYHDTSIEIPSKLRPDYIIFTLLDHNEKKKKIFTIKIEKDIEIVNNSLIKTIYHLNSERIFAIENYETVRRILNLLEDYKVNKYKSKYKISLYSLDKILSSHFMEEWSWFYYRIWDEYQLIGFNLDEDLEFLNEYIKYEIKEVKKDKNLNRTCQINTELKYEYIEKISKEENNYKFNHENKIYSNKKSKISCILIFLAILLLYRLVEYILIKVIN